jgi:hypothetical protein
MHAKVMAHCQKSNFCFKISLSPSPLERTKKLVRKAHLKMCQVKVECLHFLFIRDEHYHRAVFVLNNEIESNWKNKLNA